ncbi:MAG: division/cell wall cluster transcriptional repressor MraZ [Lentimicrobiaceae bacterium]
MIGVHECKVDNKGRIMVPTALKCQLEPNITEGFIIKRSIFQQCLEIYPRSEWDEAIKGINKLNRFVKKNNDFIRVFMAGVREVELDGTGRLLIPRELTAFAGINKDVVLASAVNIIEVWDKEKYELKITEDQENFSELAEEVMGQFS